MIGRPDLNQHNDDRLHSQLDRARRNRFRRLAILPFALVLAIGAAYLGIALSMRSPVQVAVLSNSTLTLLLLCPAALCLFPLVIISVALVALVNRWQRASVSPLRRLEAWTATLEDNADKWLGQIDERVLEAAVAFAPIRQLLRAFDTIADDEENEVES